MSNQQHSCTHCGGYTFWRRFTDGLRRVFTFKQKEDRLMYIPIDQIDPNPLQPRKHVLEQPLDDLRKSIEQYGVIVPLIVNRRGSRYVLVAGQRRLKAAREVGFRNVPAIVRSLEARQMMEVSALENLHRESLTPIDVVKMFDRMSRKHPRISPEDMADAMGLKLEDLEQTRRLLDLPFPVLEALRAGMIGEEHAQLLAQIEDPDAQLEMIEIIYNDKLDVEKTRELVGRITQGEPSYVTADQSAHYHAPSCPFAQLIPEDRKLKFYTKQEVSSRGKVPCMQCL